MQLNHVNGNNKLHQSAVKNNSISTEADRVVVTYYTDPLCCWSWAFHDAWDKAQEELAPFIDVSYVMCGMIPSWNKFEDPLNNISTAAQMGPLWMHASQQTKKPIASEVWVNDPPSSSFPACIAVKCAGLQSASAAVGLFKKLQAAVMLWGLNISREEVILNIAKEFALTHSALFNYATFEKDWMQGTGKTLLRGDIQQALYFKIGRYPTITMTHPGKEGIMMVGYRPYEVLLEGFKRMLA